MTGDVNTAGAWGTLHKKRSLTSVAVFPAVAASPASRAQQVEGKAHAHRWQAPPAGHREGSARETLFLLNTGAAGPREKSHLEQSPSPHRHLTTFLGPQHPSS